MGYYINPTDTTKEEWLLKHGKRATSADCLRHDFASSDLPVVLVDNGPFTAAAICYNSRETEEFTRSSDKRPKMFFIVTKSDLKPWYKG